MKTLKLSIKDLQISSFVTGMATEHIADLGRASAGQCTNNINRGPCTPGG